MSKIMRQHVTIYAKHNADLFTQLYDKYKKTKPTLINKTIVNVNSSKIGTYIEKYIQYKINPQIEFTIQPGLVDLRNIQIPKLNGKLEFNKIIYSNKLMGEVDIFQIDNDKQMIMDIKCVTQNCDKYCFVQQCLYTYLFYKLEQKIPQNQIYFVYAQKFWQWQLDLEDMDFIKQILQE